MHQPNTSKNPTKRSTVLHRNVESTPDTVSPWAEDGAGGQHGGLSNYTFVYAKQGPIVSLRPLLYLGTRWSS